MALQMNLLLQRDQAGIELCNGFKKSDLNRAGPFEDLPGHRAPPHSGAGRFREQQDCGDAEPVTARKDDAPAAVQAAFINLAGLNSISVDGGLIQATSG